MLKSRMSTSLSLVRTRKVSVVSPSDLLMILHRTYRRPHQAQRNRHLHVRHPLHDERLGRTKNVRPRHKMRRPRGRRRNRQSWGSRQELEAWYARWIQGNPTLLPNLNARVLTRSSQSKTPAAPANSAATATNATAPKPS
jgi:hypothetical protein